LEEGNGAEFGETAVEVRRRLLGRRSPAIGGVNEFTQKITFRIVGETPKGSCAVEGIFFE
jgi:hypothetical protein